jgi:hypothetical protein
MHGAFKLTAVYFSAVVVQLGLQVAGKCLRTVARFDVPPALGKYIVTLFISDRNTEFLVNIVAEKQAGFACRLLRICDLLGQIKREVFRRFPGVDLGKLLAFVTTGYAILIALDCVFLGVGAKIVIFAGKLTPANFGAVIVVPLFQIT